MKQNMDRLTQQREYIPDIPNHLCLLFSPSFLSRLEKGTLITYQITYKTSAIATEITFSVLTHNISFY